MSSRSTDRFDNNFNRLAGISAPRHISISQKSLNAQAQRSSSAARQRLPEHAVILWTNRNRKDFRTFWDGPFESIALGEIAYLSSGDAVCVRE